MILHERYVSFEVAKMLKQAGFDFIDKEFFMIPNGHVTNWQEYILLEDK